MNTFIHPTHPTHPTIPWFIIITFFLGNSIETGEDSFNFLKIKFL